MNILEEAGQIIHGARRDAYGPVRESFDRVAKVWEAILLRPITAEEVAMCMVGLKLCREANKHQRDNLTDICGYTALLEMLEAEPRPDEAVLKAIHEAGIAPKVGDTTTEE